MSTIEQTWTDRGDSAAREDLRAGHSGEWDKSAVLAHLGIFDETDTEAAAYGLAGDDLAAFGDRANVDAAVAHAQGLEAQNVHAERVDVPLEAHP